MTCDFVDFQDGSVVLDSVSGTGTVVIEQQGCDIIYDAGGDSVPGDVEGNQVRIAGPLEFGSTPGVQFTGGDFTASAIVFNEDEFTLNGRLNTRGAVERFGFSCTGPTTDVLTRISRSGTPVIAFGSARREPQSLAAVVAIQQLVFELLP